MQAKHLRLILGDQLNAMHSWFEQIDDDVIYLIAELHQEASYTKHHIKKITSFFAAMADFAKILEKKGHRVCYLTLDESSQYQDLPHLIKSLVTH
jgi:deoxyribodipyrimidine photolyase-related protein